MNFDNKAAAFWNKDSPRVMGDLRARPNAIRLLGDIKGKTILDAGCGTGYFSRMLARQGARVYGIDESSSMLQKAIDNKNPIRQKIIYQNSRIVSTGFNNESLDVATLVGVLMYEPRLDLTIREMHRVLKEDGNLQVSVTHPYMYQENSPARDKKDCWLKLKETDLVFRDESRIFEQKYMDINGRIFKAEVFDHHQSKYFNDLISEGFEIQRVEEILVREEDLMRKSWGKKYGYPAYLQILARKR